MKKDRFIVTGKIRVAFFCLMAAVLIPVSFGSAMANDAVAIIVNKGNAVNALTLEEVHEFYHNEKLNWPKGKKVTLYDLKVKDEARKKFSKEILGKDPEKVAMEWANKKITNQAKNPPRTVTSANLVQQRVAKDPAALGYLFQRDVTSDKVKIIAVIE